MIQIPESIGHSIETFLLGLEERSRSGAWAIAMGAGLGVAAVVGGLCAFLVVLFVLTKIFA